MRFSIDTNVLVYAVRPEEDRATTARRILRAAILADCWLTNQVFGEFLNVVRRKSLVPLDEARRAVLDWSVLFPVAPSATEHLVQASALAETQRLQFWDSLILTVCGACEVEYLLSEDMQDGATPGGVTLVNPFNPANAGLLDALLTPLP